MTVFFVEVLERYGESLLAEWTLATAALGCLLLGTLVVGEWLPWTVGRRVRVGALLVTVTAGAAYSIKLAWIADDAFISFRYAQNLADGHGLVFNLDERVEGYTNFLWTVILAGGMKLGLPPVQLSMVLSLMAAGATVILAANMAARLSPNQTGHRPLRSFFPLAGVTLALNYTFASFGTSGLETMAGALCALVAVDQIDRGKPVMAGTASVAAAMLHPDHALFYGALGLVLVGTRRWRELAIYGLPGALLYVPYFLWRYQYYGELFPNTYYAKSGGLTYFSQGFRYLWICSVGAGLPVLLPLVAYSAYRFRRHLLAQYAVVALPIYLLYVAKIGGDFMLGRLLVAVLPPVAILSEAGVNALWGERRVPLALLAVAAMAPMVVPASVVHGAEKYHHVADERRFYELVAMEPPEIRSPSEHWAGVFNRHFADADHPPTIGIGCIGIVGFKTRLPIIDTFGLTDATVARQHLVTRARPGHEKRAHAEYLIERGVDFSDQSLYPAPYAKLTELKLEGLPFFLGRYHAGLWQQAGGDPKVGLRDFPQWLNRYNAHRPTAAGSACDAWFMQQFYFRHNADPGLKDRLRARFLNAKQATGVTQHFLFGPPETGWSSRRIFGLDQDYPSWTATGAAFAHGAASGSNGPQSHVAYADGGFANSFGVEGLDGLVGTLQSPPFILDGDVLTAMVGGGRHKAKVRMEVLVNGSPIASIAGCNSEVLSQRAIDVRKYRGRQATIRLTDRSVGGWGHLLVDDIRLWSTTPKPLP